MTNQVSSAPQAATQQSTLLQAYLMIEELEAQLAAATATQRAPIAIVGMACRFPGASDPAAFWRLLRDGVDATGEMPQERWDVDAYYDSNPEAPGKMYVRCGGFLDHIDSFDAPFFTISPREATAMAPEQRFLLEVAWEALEDAGINPHTLRDSATGVFVGCDGLTNEYLPALVQVPPQFIQYIETGNSNSVIAGRLAYSLGLQGPTLVTATACSSSLVAVHAAVQSLRTGECRAALVGSVQLYLSLDFFVVMSKMHALAPDGRCKTFDALADGYSRGEGCGVIVLKRVDDARADGDRILAVIHGSAINHDGASAGLTVPNGIAQEKVIRQAQKSANVTPDAISYIEAHGTGTPLGDPIEIQALGRVFGAREKPLLVGSVKTNIGHLESAAGIAGLIKVVLSLQHQTIPPHLHFQTPNPHIPWEELPLQIPTTCMPWPAPEPTERRGRLAGVSSFGLSGTNAHVILGEAPALKPKPATTEPPQQLLTLSAKSAEALHALAARYIKHLCLPIDEPFHDICFTANHGRAHFAHRLAVVAATKAEAGEKLTAFTGSVPTPDLFQGTVAVGSGPTVAFLFTGQGAQYVNMGRELYATQPIFRTVIDRCDEVLQQCLGRSLLDLLYPTAQPGLAPGHNDLLESHPCGQAANFALECALADLWRAWGVQPDLVLGHSLGDFAAAYTAGVIALEDGLRLVTERGRLMERAVGTMVSVLASEAEVAPFITSFRDVAVGVINGPRSVVISGGQAHVEHAQAALQTAGFKTRKLAIPVAAHSPMLDPVLDAFEAAVRKVKLSKPQIPIVSSMTGKLVSHELVDPVYWRRHLRHPVRFAEGVQTLREQDCTIYLEIGPKPTLLALAEQSHAPMTSSTKNHPSIVSSSHPVMLTSLREGCSDWQQMLTSLGAMYVSGVAVDWKGFDHPDQGNKVVLPSYPFQRRRYWLRSLPTPASKMENGRGCLIDKLTQSPRVKEIIGETHFSVERFPFLADHQVFGALVSPGACQWAMVLEAAHLAYPGRSVRLVDVVLPQALTLGEGETRTVQVIFTPEPPLNGKAPTTLFELISFQATQPNTSPQLHANGRLDFSPVAQTSAVDLAALRARCPIAIDPAALTAQAVSQQIYFGPCFDWLTEIWCGEKEAVGRLVLPEAIGTLQGYLLHPAQLDACLQLTGVLPLGTEQSETWLPFGLEALSFMAPVTGQEWWCHVQQLGAQRWHIQLLDEAGLVILTIEGFTARLAAPHLVLGTEAWRDWLYRVAWQIRPSFGHLPTYLPAPTSIGQTIAEQANTWFATPTVQRQQSALCELNALCVDYILAAFAKVGFHFTEGAHWRIDPLARQLGVIPSYRRLLDRLLQILASAEILAQTQAGWQVLRTPALRSPQIERQRLQSEYGAVIEAELTLLARCAESLGEVLRGVQDPLELLFPGGDAGLVNRTYQNTPVADAMNQVVHQAIQRALAQLPAGRGVRILEIGAGTGGTTASLLPLLPAAQTDYLFTDIGTGFLQTAQEKFAEYPFLRYQTLDIEQPPAQQGIDAHRYDIVIAANVLHATRDLAQTLAHVRQLLAPNGLLLLLEGTVPDNWVDLTFGLTEGWWRFSDQRRHHPLLSAKEWQQLLLASDFQTVDCVPEVAVADGELGQGLIIAQASSTVAASERVWLLLADKAGMGEALAAELRRRGEQPILAYTGDVYGTVTAKDSETPGIQRFYLRPDCPADYQQMLTALRELHHVVQLWSLDTGSVQSADAVEAAMRHACGTTLHLIQSLLLNRTEQPRLWLVTRDAQAVLPTDDLTGIAQATLWGLGRTVALEHPEFQCTCLDLGGDIPLAEQVTTLCAQLIAAGATTPQETQVALRNDNSYVARLVRHDRPQTSPLTIRPDATYLLTGGLGGLGLQVARWLVEQGARSLLLLGRRGPTSAAQQTIAELEGGGATITVVQADVSRQEEVAQALAQIPAERPLRGVIHAAGVLDDGILLEQSWERFAKVLGPKVAGAWHLHTLTQAMPLDFFVLFSSAAGLLGSRGQANHAAANALLDSLAAYRRARQLPALSIDWGAWSEIGAAAAMVEREQVKLAEQGQGVIDPVQGIQSFAGLLQQDEAHVAIMPVRWEKFLAQEQAPSAFFAHFAQQIAPPKQRDEPMAKPQVSLRHQLEQATAAQRHTLLVQHVQTVVAEVLGWHSAKQIDPYTGLTALGLDSLMAIELRRKLERSLQISLRSTVVFEYPTVEELTTHVLEQLPTVADLSVTETPHSTLTVANQEDNLDSLSPQELAQLLAAELETA